MTIKPLIMHTDGQCRQDSPGGSIPASDQLVSILQPVGSGFQAKNLNADVRTIQNSFNEIDPKHGAPVEMLVVDGICGSKTKKAITDFQIKQFGIKSADGLIEPGKQTIQRINQILFSNVPVDPNEEAAIRARMVSHLGLVTQAIHAAQTNLSQAMLPAGGLDLGRGRAGDRVDRHFALNTLNPAARSKAISDILAVFNLYQRVLLLPPELELGFLGSGAFVTDPTGDPRIAFTFANGFFRTGERDPARNIPLDRIFLGRRAFFALTDGEFCAFIMLHEVAHFVGFADKSFIIDNGRGWFSDSTIQALNPDQRLHNADSYATFATECRTGSAVKPAYVKAANTSR